MISDDRFLRHVTTELKHARGKFPKGDKLLGATMEELGEVAKALLKITEDGELQRGELLKRRQDVYDECVQLASTALRLAVEGEQDYAYPGTKCQYLGCDQPAVGGPCATCYE